MKVLIISHLPVATQNNMGRTFLSLFSDFERDELCQLYIYPAIPDVDRCASYYRVTDKEILGSLLGRGKAGGEIERSRINAGQGLYENEADESIYRNRKNKSAIRRLLRDAMWAISGWYNQKLLQWLDREQPTCIFVAPGAACFAYTFALRIAKARKIPIVTYICDEYYFVREPGFGLEALRLRLLKSRMEKLLAQSSHLVVISDELNEAYTAKFGLQTTTLMTGTNYAIAGCPKLADEPKEICYFGNIRCNRFRSLAEVGRELDAINRELGTSCRLKIYSSEKEQEILSTFRGIQSVELCGFVTGAEFDQVFQEAPLLLHVEAFDEASMEAVQHSVSTKIADSLASGTPLLAYGPAGVSSMQHLLRHDCAITATSGDGLRAMLLTALTDAARRKETAERGLKVARMYHDSKAVSQKLRDITESLMEVLV